MKSGIAAVVCTLLLLYCGTSAALEYSAKPITARVVDAETKEPLEGVVVVAHWQLNGGLEGWSPLAELMVMDAVTDQSGTFHFPAWGPKKISAGLDSNARLKEFDPQLLLFKSGYRWQMLFNSKSEEQMSHKVPGFGAPTTTVRPLSWKSSRALRRNTGGTLTSISPFSNH